MTYFVVGFAFGSAVYHNQPAVAGLVLLIGIGLLVAQQRLKP